MSKTRQFIILNAAAATGKGTAQLVADFRHVTLQVAMANFTGTVKFAISDADTMPDFDSAASASNPWSYVQVKDLIDNSSVNGGTGVAGVAATSVANYEVNTNSHRWVCAIVTAFTDGTVTVKGSGATDTY